MREDRRRREVKVPRPARLVATAFAGAILLGTLLLMIPAASVGEGGASFLTALFTSTSAVCVTGLTVVDTATAWTPLGQAIILLLFQLGGLGILTLASVSLLLLSGRMGLRRRIQAQAETGTLDVGETRTLVVRIVRFSLVFEALVALVLTGRFLVLGEDPGTALWHGVFHSVSSYNQAGFALYTDSFVQFATDPWISVATMVAMVVGGLGFPVIFELARRARPRAWTLHTKLTLVTTTALYVLGAVVITALEWGNRATLGPLSVPAKLLAGTFHSVTPRSGGLNTIDVGAMEDSTLLFTNALMFIGGGTGSTAGGIKVTTFALLAFVIWSELRGEQDVNLFERRCPTSAVRQALTVALTSVGAVMVGTMVLLVVTPFELGEALFEVTSAAATVGLSTGITPELGAAGQLLLVALMYLGRIGPLTLGTALALREGERLYRYPEERPLVG